MHFTSNQEHHTPRRGFTSAVRGNQIVRMPLLLCVLLSVTVSHADLVISWSGGMEGIHREEGVWGYDFTVGAMDLLVMSLGVWDRGENGLGVPHPVGLWNTAGDLLAQVTVQAGAESPLKGQFRYEDLFAPVTLDAHASYVLAASFSPNDDDRTLSWTRDVELGAGIASVGDPLYVLSPGLVFPDTAMDRLSFGFLGPNMQYQVVPEPGTFALMGCGVATLLFRNRRRLFDGLHNRR